MTQAVGGTPSFNSRFPPRSHLQLLAVIALTLAAPVAIRLVSGGTAAATSRLPYLPVFPGERTIPFHAERLDQLRRMNPGAVVIGDSMAGTRIDEKLLGQLSGVPVAPLLQAASGPVFWYLALKNWVVASGITPRVVFIFAAVTELVVRPLGDEQRLAGAEDPGGRVR